MRRAALQIVRCSRRPVTRKPLLRRNVLTTQPGQAVSGIRSLSTKQRATNSEKGALNPLQSSMHLRSFSAAAITAAIASGAYYYNQAGSRSSADTGASPADVSISASSAQVSPSLAGSSAVTSEQAAQSTRRALMIEQGQVYSGTIIGDEPLTKDTDDYGRKVVEMLTPEQATQRLRKNEESWSVGRGKGVVRYDIVQIPSNDPIEDDYSHKIIEVPQSVAATETPDNSDWMFWGVFDGHSGWTTSAKLRQTLIHYVARELNTTYMSALKNPSVKLPTPESIESAIKNGFLRLDNEIVNESVKKVQMSKSKTAAAELLAPALSGSCALLSFYDSSSKELRVACTGDSRAVLGRRGTSGKWTATPLSIDQTGGNKDEEARMRKEHPGEPDVIRNGRVLGGLEPSRAFGDASYKWSREVQEKLRKDYLGRTPYGMLRSPPYVTAEPVVTTTKVSPENGDFVVMATDGLWEMLTNEEVVGLVGQWLDTEAHNLRSTGNKTTDSWLKSWFSSGQKGLPVDKELSESAESKGGQRAPIRQQQWGLAGAEERFIVKDKNVATHLVRNALGGKDEDQLCALLTLPSPYSRRFRDDLTVQVIFFGEGEVTGNAVLNKEASAAAAQEPRPKL